MKRKPLSILTEWLLKIAMINYLAIFIFPPGKIDLLSNLFWADFGNILFFLLFLVIAFLVLLPSRQPCRIIVFSLLGLTAFLKLLLLLNQFTTWTEFSLFFLLFSISVFYLGRMYVNRFIG
ncbi:MAG: hypothetical protein ACOCPM_00190 [Bacteroidales bacterium]